MVDLDSSLLRAFVAVADDLHFGRAATRLVVSQQALSKRLQRLEQLLGTRLVERTPRSVALTAAGERLLVPARRVVDDVDAAVATVRVAERPLRVDVLEQHLWPLLLVRAAAEQGDLGIDVLVREAGRDTLDVLRSGDVDVAFGRAGALDPPWPDDLRRRLVRLEPLAVLVGADDPWAGHAGLPVAELRERPTWFPMTGAPPEWTSFLDQLADEHGLTIDYSGSTMGFEYWVERVARGGAPPTFIGLAMDLPPVPGVRVVPLVDPVPVFPWWVMWRRRLPSGPVERLLAGRAADENSVLAEVGEPDRMWLPDRDRTYAARQRVG